MKRRKPAFRRVVLKLSGEAFGEVSGPSIDLSRVTALAGQIVQASRMGVELAVVVGGGNILRGAAISSSGLSRATADYMGMLATMINGLAMQDTLEQLGAETRLMSAIKAEEVCEPFIRRRALRHLECGRIVILAGGTGNPYFTTDTTAALRAQEINAEVLLKATKVDGVYDADPQKHPSAKLYHRLTYLQVLQDGLQVMDATAISLCMDNKLPIIVFNQTKPGNIVRAVRGERIGTYVGD